MEEGVSKIGKIPDVVYGWTLIALIICLALTTSTGQRCISLLRLKKFHCSAKNLKQESIIFALKNVILFLNIIICIPMFVLGNFKFLLHEIVRV